LLSLAGTEQISGQLVGIYPIKKLLAFAKERLTKPSSVERLPTDECTADRKERLMNLRSPIIVDRQLAKAVEPDKRPLHDPPMPAEPFARLDAPANDPQQGANRPCSASKPAKI
jgi:hypothetical protein